MGYQKKIWSKSELQIITFNLNLQSSRDCWHIYRLLDKIKHTFHGCIDGYNYYNRSYDLHVKKHILNYVLCLHRLLLEMHGRYTNNDPSVIAGYCLYAVQNFGYVLLWLQA